LPGANRHRLALLVLLALLLAAKALALARDRLMLAPINVDLRRHNVGAGEHVSRALGPIDRHNGYVQSPYA
jgi:hypothetical protein